MNKVTFIRHFWVASLSYSLLFLNTIHHSILAFTFSPFTVPNDRKRLLSTKHTPQHLSSDDVAVVDTSATQVSVSVTRRIPNVSPEEVHKAWLEYTWRDGVVFQWLS